jgi:hypothetical protein
MMSKRKIKTIEHAVEVIEQDTAPVLEGDSTYLTLEDHKAIMADYEELAAADVATVAALEAIEEAVAEQSEEAPAGEPDHQPSLLELVASVEQDPEDLDTARKQVAAAFDTRADFERKKNPDNESIQTSLKKSRAKLTQGRSVAILMSAGAAPDFITRSTNEGSAYNVYAADKVADLVNALNSGVIGNAINNAVCRSLFRFRAAGEAFTGEMARAAASDKLRVQGTIAKLLVRHTVSPSTAPTQASSTMQALQTLGIVKNTGTTRAPVYALTDSPAAKRLEAVVMAA